MGLLKSLALSGLLAASAMAEYDPNKKQCGPGIGNCPSEKPCCSEYGQCGIGAYCLGGCDPLHSKSLDSCVPRPVCKGGHYTFEDLSSGAKITEYLGDASKADWVYQGQPTISKGNLVLTMPQDSVGTVLASTQYVWYGKISARLRTSRGAGVVTAFILMSDVKDEIDYEWVGTELSTTQTNYYFQGITDYHNSGNITTDDSFANWHTYEVDWTPDSITWSVDGKVGRTKKKSDTWNSTSKSYNFPQTPSRVQISLWPGGLASNGKGTIDWAGGPITWDGPDIEKNGYYYAMVSAVDIKCYDPPKAAQGKGSKAYVYTSNKATEDAVTITNDNTVLKSFLGSGTDMNAGAKPVASGTASSGSAKPTEANVETIPGMTGAGFGSNQNGGHPGDPGASANGGSGGSGGDGSGSSSANSDTNTFSQGSKSEAVSGIQARGSTIAVFIAIIAFGLL